MGVEKIKANNEITLVTEFYEVDDYGIDRIYKTEEVTVFAEKKSISQNEFYTARSHGFKTELLFLIHAFEYSNQTKIIFEERKYSVVRLFERKDDVIELYCEEKVGDN